MSDELIKQIDNLGQITNSQQQQSDFIMSKLSKSFTQQLKQHESGTTNDFSKPKNKLMNSRIMPEIAQSIKILKVLPHFKENKLLYRWTPEAASKSHEKSNQRFHECCDERGPLLALVKLVNSGAIFGVRRFN